MRPGTPRLLMRLPLRWPVEWHTRARAARFVPQRTAGHCTLERSLALRDRAPLYHGCRAGRRNSPLNMGPTHGTIRHDGRAKRHANHLGCYISTHTYGVLIALLT